MDVVQLTRALTDIESITGNECAAAEFLAAYLEALAARYGGRLERMEVEPGRFNVFACWGEPAVTLSSHIDTVPPFFPSREDDEYVHGRGACDAKGILAAMSCAIESLLGEGHRNFGLLALVGEERNSAGAFHAARHPRGSKFLINGEPTGNKLAIASKGALRCEVAARGRMAHSAYPELGVSAIDKLLDALARIRALRLPADPLLGASTLNIGLIGGGRAPNVIADQAHAELLIRLVDDGASTRALLREAAAPDADVREVLCIPALRLGTLPGFETTVVAFTTDIPALGGAWGTPYLLGPGSIHAAHTDSERVTKRDLHDAVGIYKQMTLQLGRQ
jgi:acetylornithine deacetylase